MRKLTCNIEIINDGKTYNFTYVNELQIESTYKTFTDTALVKLPSRYVDKDGRIIIAGRDFHFIPSSIIKILIGYDNNNKLEFEGYISEVRYNTTTDLYCEDEFYKLKRLRILNESYKPQKLESFISKIVGDNISYNVLDADIGDFRINNVTPAQVLEELRKVYGLNSYIKNKVLYVGLAHIESLSIEHSLIFEKNIIDDNLIYKESNNVFISIRATSMLPDNSKIEVEAGDSGGERRSLFFYNITDTNKLKEYAEREKEKYKFTGFRGTFTTFGIPSITHGDKVTLINNKYTYDDGTYQVDKVTKSFGTDGFRQNIELGAKVA